MKIKNFANLIKKLSLADGAGFTLIELIIALAVFTTGILAAFALSLANYNVANDNYQEILAANLAREGIEIVRNIRDSVWLKIEANEDCDGGVIGTQICSWDQAFNNIATSTAAYNRQSLVSTGSQNIDDCYANPASTCRLYRNADGFYDHDVSGGGTNMARLVKLKTICMDFDGTGAENVWDTYLLACNGEFERKIGYQVTATVRWYKGDQHHDVTITDKIYNWNIYDDYQYVNE